MSYFKRFLIFALSALLIVAQPVAYAASPTGWTASSVNMNGATATITAIKGAGSSAMQAVITHKPTAAKVGKEILKGGGLVAVAYAMSQLVGAGVDWVLDPANNRVKIINPPTDRNFCATRADPTYPEPTFPKKEELAVTHCASSGGVKSITPDGVFSSYSNFRIECNDYKPTTIHCYAMKDTMPIATVAAQVISNAAAGHIESQGVLEATVVTGVDAGEFDTKFTAAAEPYDPTAPVDPVDPTDPTNPTDPVDPTDPTLPPFDPSSIIAAIQSLASMFVAAFNGLTDAIGVTNTKLDDVVAEQQNTNQVVNDSIDRVIANDDARIADIVAAIEAIEGNTLTGEVINDAVDRVIAEGKTNTSDIVAAIEAIEGNTLTGEVINDAVDRVIANDNANAQSAAEAAEAAEAARTTNDDTNTTAVTDAIEAAEAARAADAQEAKEAADAKAAADAAALEWAKEAPEAPTDTGVVVDEPISDFDSDKSYITFTGSCPPKYTASLSIMGATAPFEFDYTPICTVMSYLKPFIVGAGYIAAAYIIAGHSRGSKD